MARYAALLRAVNVGGTTALPMSRLKAVCLDAGLEHVETYIASGNVVFESKAAPAKIKATLEAALRKELGKPVGVVLRSAAELRAVLKASPFRNTEPKYTHVIFLDTAPPADALDHVRGRRDEELRLAEREIYVHYPSGMGRSKLRIPAASEGTARNINTVTKLVELTSKP
ncbi:MAG: DUF1697 domain-containing protein [Xanthobacteraceae bacterium]|nr:DUF1697 domain-containing protein [Xanthobacteraceae bacterium]MBX9841867.1 DUF1697 domain-containing protein [Xanthobacteraceae bacterium]